MRTAIIIGASSGIGESLARTLSSNGLVLGLAARRRKSLDALANELGTPCHVVSLDVQDTEATLVAFDFLASQLGKVDLVVISAGIGAINHELDIDPELETVRTNVHGFTAVSAHAVKHLVEQNHGTLVGITSLAGLRGSAAGASYSASKAYQQSYLEGLRLWVGRKADAVRVIDIRPGFVETAMAKGEGLFWVASPEKAATQILQVIRSRKDVGYITRRWRLIAMLLILMPRRLLRHIQ